MCFAIPYKVTRIEKGIAYLEGGKSVRLGPDIIARKGTYLQVSGDIAVGSLTKTQGLKIRKLIQSLNTYE